MDVRVINALGHDHFDDTISAPLKAAEAYRGKALIHNQTAERCQAQVFAYEPLVFTCQGGVEKYAESIVSQLAQAVGQAEETDPWTVKADSLERIGVCLARHMARAIARRIPKLVHSTCHPIMRCLREAADEDDAVDAGTYVAVPQPAQDIRLRA